MKPVELSIVIPAFNEEARLPLYLSKIRDYLRGKNLSYEVIVVDDGSGDGTAGLVEELMTADGGLSLLRIPVNRGKGHAVRAGMLQARGKLRLFADADGATPIDELDRLRGAIRGGADIAIASRAIRNDRCVIRAHPHRKVMGAVFNALVNLMAVSDIKDSQCGFKLFTAAAADALFPLQRVEGFGFDVELLYLGRKKGLRLDEIPVNWTNISGSKVRLVRDSLRMLTEIVEVRLNDLRGHYGETAGEQTEQTAPDRQG